MSLVKISAYLAGTLIGNFCAPLPRDFFGHLRYNFNKLLQDITYQNGRRLAFSMPASLNMETLILGGHNKIPREMCAVIEDMMNMLGNFGVDLQLQKKKLKNCR